MSRPRIGVLAVQGGFHAHLKVLTRMGTEAVEVRLPDELGGLDALVLPGGESTTIRMGIESDGMAGALRDAHRSGMPIMATCAGMILAGQGGLGLADYETRRNAFGRQLASFETDLGVAGLEGGPFRAVFIRAPWVERVGEEVEVLASVDEHPVALRKDNLVAFAFHPELTDDDRLHRLALFSS